MSAATSPGTGLAYGLRRVCAAWGMARSSFYVTSGQHAEQPPAKRRGPKPAISDEALLVAIADLETSPWEGEGYRKVWARLRVCRDIRVAAGAPPDAREQSALAPSNPHDGEIEPHVGQWRSGVHGGHGWGWIFTAVEHWNAECVMSASLRRPAADLHGGLPGCMARPRPARLWPWRMDHGSQYLSDHFTNQIKFFQPSYAFVAEPQTNGVTDRFNRTLKEQIIHGRIYRNIAELRDAVRDFVEHYRGAGNISPSRRTG